MKKYIEPAIKVKFLGTESEMMAATSGVGMNTGDIVGNEKGSGGQMSKDFDWDDEEDDE